MAQELATTPRPQATEGDAGSLSYFPGAFKNTHLSGAATNPTIFSPITFEEIYRAISFFDRRIREWDTTGRFGIAAVPTARLLAQQDPSGESVRAFAEGLQQIEGLKAQLLEAVRAGGQLPAPVTRALEYAGGATAGSEHAVPDRLSKERPAGTDERPPTSLPVAFHPEDLADLLTTAVVEAVGTELVYREKAAPEGLNRESVEALRTRLESTLEGFHELDRALHQDQEAASRLHTALASCSPFFRVWQFIKDWQNLNRQLEPVREALGKLEREYPMFPPNVLLHSSPGTLFESSGGPVTKVSPADDEALATNTLLVIGPKGLEAVWAHYDYEWGHLRGNNRYNFEQAIHDAMFAKSADDTLQIGDLKRLIELFPVVDQAVMQAVRQIQNPDGTFTDSFKEYLGDRSQWFGPQLLPNKPWLEKLTPELTALLTQASASLRDPSAHPFPAELLGELPKLRPLFSSFLRNSQAEDFAADFVVAALRSGTSLADMVLPSYGTTSAGQYLENLSRSEVLLHLARYFTTDAQGGVRLSPTGLLRTEKLIDPAYPYHLKADNDLDALEDTQRMKRRFGR